MAIMIVVGVIILGLIGALLLIITLDPGPSPSDVAVAYEAAWDHLDFDTLWTLAGDELRDGLDRKEFVEAKRVAYQDQPGLRGLADHVHIDAVTEGRNFAVVRTSVDLRDGGCASDALQLAKRGGRWLVVAYQLEPDAAGT